MDEVFAQYCKKWPDVYSCFHDATLTVRRCLSEKEKKAFNKTLDIVNEFQQFMCFKDGDRLASKIFIHIHKRKTEIVLN